MSTLVLLTITGLGLGAMYFLTQHGGNHVSPMSPLLSVVAPSERACAPAGRSPAPRASVDEAADAAAAKSRCTQGVA